MNENTARKFCWQGVAGTLSTLALVAGGAFAAERGGESLASYVGKYPFDRVAGISFRKDRRVVAAVTAALPGTPAANDIKQLVLALKDAVDSPIVALSAGRLYARSFDPAGGGATNWAILITGDGAKAAICYSDDAVYGRGISHWYFEREEAFTLEGPCPSEANEIETAVGQWPVGPIPN